MATPSDVYDTMKLAELLEDCAERGLEPGALKGNALREMLRRDDAQFGLGRAPLPEPRAVATGLPPMPASVAAAAAMRRAWGDSADSIATAARIKQGEAAERAEAMAALAATTSTAAARARRPATAGERSVLALQRHVAASAASAEATPELKHPPWIEAARADRQRQIESERLVEAAPKAWSRGARADDELNDVPTQAELSSLPVPLNPTRLRIMMGQDLDIVVRNPDTELPPPHAKDAPKERAAAAAAAAAHAAAQAASEAQDSGAGAGAGLDTTASTASTLPLYSTTALAPVAVAAAAAATATTQQRPGSAASHAQSLRPGSARTAGLGASQRPGSARTAGLAATQRPGSASQARAQAHAQAQAPHASGYNVELAAAAATAGLRAEEMAAVKAANAARGIGDYTSGFDAAAFAGSFTLVSAAQRKAARRVGLLTPGQGSSASVGGGGAAGARSLALRRPSSARPASASAAAAAAAAAAQQQLAAPAATDRLGRPGSALATSGGEAGEYLSKAPRHVRYVADLRRQVAEVGAEVRTARDDLLAHIAELLEPHWRPPVVAAAKAGVGASAAAAAVAAVA